MAKKINSRDKGARGEREFCRCLLAHGIGARRGQQYKGSPDSPDVCTCLDGFLHFEVKRVESFNAYKAIDQAAADAGPGQSPVVAHKRNGKPWLLVMRADDLLPLLAKQGEADRLADLLT